MDDVRHNGMAYFRGYQRKDESYQIYVARCSFDDYDSFKEWARYMKSKYSNYLGSGFREFTKNRENRPKIA